MWRQADTYGAAGVARQAPGGDVRVRELPEAQYPIATIGSSDWTLPDSRHMEHSWVVGPVSGVSLSSAAAVDVSLDLN